MSSTVGVSPEAQGQAQKTRQTNQALVLLLLGGALIGCSPIFVRLSEVQAVSTAFWRLALALLPLSFVAWRNGGGTATKPTGWRDITAVSLPGVLLGTELAIWHISLHLTSVANSTLLVNMAPIFVALYSWVLLGKKPNRLFLLALLVTLSGVVVLKGGFASLGAGTLGGDLTAILAAVFYAGYILALGQARLRFSASVIMIWSTTAASLFILPVALMAEPNLFPQTLNGWGILFGLAWLSQAAGQSMIAYSLAWLPATFSSLTLLLQPVVAAILAWPLLGEVITPWQVIGGVIVIAGIWIARMSQR